MNNNLFLLEESSVENIHETDTTCIKITFNTRAMYNVKFFFKLNLEHYIFIRSHIDSV